MYSNFRKVGPISVTHTVCVYCLGSRYILQFSGLCIWLLLSRYKLMFVHYKLFYFTSLHLTFFQICLVCLLILNTDTSIFSTYWYWYLCSIFQIEYWYWYFTIWKLYWILNTSTGTPPLTLIFETQQNRVSRKPCC